MQQNTAAPARSGCSVTQGHYYDRISCVRQCSCYAASCASTQKKTALETRLLQQQVKFLWLACWIFEAGGFFLFGAAAPPLPVGQSLLFLEVSRSHTTTHHTDGRTPLDERSARRRDLYLTTHNAHNRWTSMLPVGFEPTISADLRLRPRGHWDRPGVFGII